MPTTALTRFRPRRQVIRRKPRRRTFARVPKGVTRLRHEFTKRKLRFVLYEGQSHALISTAGVISTDYVYRANDLYDPFAGAGGQQPRCFDQYMTLYRNFAVLGSKLTVNIGYGQASSTSEDMICCVVLSDFTSSINNQQDAIEYSRSKYKFLSAGQDNKQLVSKYSYKINGCQDIMDHDDLWGSSSGSPSKGWNFHIVGWCPSGSTETLKISGYIDYSVIFFHPVLPTAS